MVRPRKIDWREEDMSDEEIDMLLADAKSMMMNSLKTLSELTSSPKRRNAERREEVLELMEKYFGTDDTLLIIGALWYFKYPDKYERLGHAIWCRLTKLLYELG